MATARELIQSVQQSPFMQKMTPEHLIHLDVSMDPPAILACAKALKHELSLKELPEGIQ